MMRGSCAQIVMKSSRRFDLDHGGLRCKLSTYMMGEERSVSESCSLKSTQFHCVKFKIVEQYLPLRTFWKLTWEKYPATCFECHNPSNAFMTVTIPGSVLAFIWALDMKKLLSRGTSTGGNTCSRRFHTQCHSRSARKHYFPVKI